MFLTILKASKALMACNKPKHKDHPDLVWTALVFAYEDSPSAEFEDQKILNELEALVPGDNRINFMAEF